MVCIGEPNEYYIYQWIFRVNYIVPLYYDLLFFHHFILIIEFLNLNLKILIELFVLIESLNWLNKTILFLYYVSISYSNHLLSAIFKLKLNCNFYWSPNWLCVYVVCVLFYNVWYIYIGFCFTVSNYFIYNFYTTYCVLLLLFALDYFFLFVGACFSSGFIAWSFVIDYG